MPRNLASYIKHERGGVISAAFSSRHDLERVGFTALPSRRDSRGVCIFLSDPMGGVFLPPLAIFPLKLSSHLKVTIPSGSTNSNLHRGLQHVFM